MDQQTLDYISARVAVTPMREGMTDCWLWSLAVNSRGYGICFKRDVRTVAHRYTYRAAKGEIPEGYEVDHLCMVKRCVNPDHLEAVTRQENIRRAATARTGRVYSIYKRGADGMWIAAVENGMRNGKRHRKAFVAKTEDLVRAKVEQFLAERA